MSHDTMDDSAEGSQGGIPEISTAVPEASELDNTESPDLEESSKPSAVKFFLVIVFFCAILSAIGYGGLSAYRQYIASSSSVESTQPEEELFKGEGLGSFSKMENSEDVSVHEPIPEPNIEVGDEYSVTEPGALVETEKQPTISKEEFEQLKVMTRENYNLLNTLLSNQNNILQQGNAQNKTMGEINGVLSVVKDDIGAVISGQETLSHRLRSQGQTVKKIENSAKAEKEARKALKARPLFRVTDHSLWGDTVTLMIENRDGFYQSANVGTSINEWVLRRIDLKKKVSYWERAGERGTYELKW